MEQYLLGWLHAVGIIFIIAMVSGLVIMMIKISEPPGDREAITRNSCF